MDKTENDNLELIRKAIDENNQQWELRIRKLEEVKEKSNGLEESEVRIEPKSSTQENVTAERAILAIQKHKKIQKI